MDENVLTDLKQFITATVSQSTSELEAQLKKLDQKIDSTSDALDKKIDNLSVFVADALDASNEAIQMQLKEHDRRITRLEHKLA